MKSSSKEPETIIIEERITKVNGEFFVKKYAQGQLLGKGGFAKVYLFTNLENNKVMAGKVIPKINLNRSRSRQKLMVEIRLHQSLHHQNIVKFEHVFEDQENVYILLELCQNQSMNELFKRRKRLTEFEVQCYLIQLVDAIKYMHSNRIIHRDLKLGNLFLNDQMQIKIGDFGLAAKLEFDGEKKRTICGTPNYIAPEILDGNIGHSYEVDVWSIGVILFTLLTGKPPFETTDIKLTYKRIKENNYSFPDNVTLSSNVKDLIKKILVTQPEKRPTLDEILHHPFIDYGGPIPKLMPVSTLACPPSSSYLKQFSSSTTSQRIRNATEIDPHDSQDGSSNPKAYFVNTNKPSALPKTPSGSQIPTIDLFRMTPKTPQLQFFGQDRFNPAAIVSHYKSKIRFPTTPQTQTQNQNPNQKIFFPIEVQEEVQEKEHIPTIVEEDHKTMETDREELGLRVLKWYDYSTKYGLGYILSNGTIGVSFNDGTKVVVPPGNAFEYIKKDPSGKSEIRKKYSFEEYPEDLHQKVLIYNRFKEHFESVITDSVRIKDLIYIKKWIKTKAAIFFRLNNRVLQVSFKDNTTIIMDTDEKKLTFIGQKDDVHFCPLESAATIEDKEISKRVKYIEEVLRQIWTVQSEQTMAKKNENVSSEERDQKDKVENSQEQVQ